MTRVRRDEVNKGVLRRDKMKQFNGFIVLGLLLLLAGCASVDMVDYTVSTQPEVKLRDRSRVRIVAASEFARPIVDSMKKTFDRNGEFRVVEKDADYWFVVNGAKQHTSQEALPQYRVVEIKNGDVVREEVRAVTRSLSSSAGGVSVAVYETGKLTPVFYLDIPVYLGDNTEGGARSKAMREDRIAKEVAERIGDAFLTQSKKIQTPVPRIADSRLKEYFADGKYRSFLLEYKRLGRIDLKKFCEDFQGGRVDESIANFKLANYYLYLLVRERLCSDAEVMEKTRGEHLRILEATSAEGIAESVPVALARLEQKLCH